MNKMFVLTRCDLRRSQPAVQACHAVAEYLLHEQNHGWGNGTMILLGVRNRADLEKWEQRLAEANHAHRTFVEPDIGDQKTALAFVGAPSGLETDLGQLRLL